MPTPHPHIIPSINAKSRAEFTKKLKQMEGLVPLIQVDVMDGKFVPVKNWFDPKVIAGLKTKMKFELHLMVNDPLTIIDDWRLVAGLQSIIYHVESPIRLATAIKKARSYGLRVGLAICPDTPISRVTSLLKKIDLVLVMGGVPGFSGKPLDSNTIDTVRVIRKHSKTIPIGFDIGVSRETIPTLVQAGVTNLCSTSVIFKAKSPRKEFAVLTKIAEQASRS